MARAAGADEAEAVKNTPRRGRRGETYYNRHRKHVRNIMQYRNVSFEEDSEVNDELLERRLDLIRQAIVGLVRRDGPDLTARQLAILLTTYLESDAQTVRGLAAQLHVAKPAITRALDRLAEFHLVHRKQDPLDRRSILVQRTKTGMEFLHELSQIVADSGVLA
jgi:DNA-binding MarR family transcriptional regulator